jgi:hypothetical protein
MSEQEKEVFVNPIDADKVADNPGLLPYASNVGGVVIKPEDTGKIKGRAVKAMEQQTDMQLRQIQKQIELLAKQAHAIKSRTEISYQIYEAVIGFEPLIGQLYHLYRRADGMRFVSLVAPHEWGRSQGDRTFIASVRLLADHTWEVVYAEEDLT